MFILFESNTTCASNCKIFFHNLIRLRVPMKSGHRGLGFVTFTEDGVAERVCRRSREICGHQVTLIWIWFDMFHGHLI